MNKLNPLYIIIFVASIFIQINVSFCHTDIVKRVEVFFNSINTLSAKFIQLGPENNTKREGYLYISKPGRLKWDYIKPKKITMISNQDKVSYYDHEMEELSYIKYDDALLQILTAKNIVLKNIANIVSTHEDKNNIEIVLTKKSVLNSDDSQYIKIIFTRNPHLSLDKLSILNEDSTITNIMLSEVQLNKKIDLNVFVSNEKKILDLNRD